MSDSTKPAWPDPSALPFMMFGAQPPAAASTSQPLSQGMDLFKQFWSNLPGGNALPGFLVPTVDVEELDKRLSDLRAAEKWLEVNLTMLRATIQGLEVQRNTIAAIHSLSAMAEGTFAPKPAAADAGTGVQSGWPGPAAVGSPSPEPAPAPDEEKAAANPLMSGLAANNWLGFLQDQFSKVAQAALAGSPPATATPKPAARKTPARAPAKKSKRRSTARNG